MNFDRIMLIINTIAVVICAIAAVYGTIRHKEAKKLKKKTNTIIIWLPIILMFVFIGPTFYFWKRPPRDSSRFNFESDTMGWEVETYQDSQGFDDRVQSNETAKYGNFSLKLSANLEGGHPNRSKGEVFVEIPIQNMENKPITAWVYVPRTAIGDPQKPNGMQLFVKDKDWKAEYGTWWNITPSMVGKWKQITLTPNTTSAPPDGYMEAGFDSTQIRAIGVKGAIGEGSTSKYTGPIYIDSVDWQN